RGRGGGGGRGGRSGAVAETGTRRGPFPPRRHGECAIVNPSTAFGTVFADELVRCGLREVVVAPGSRSTPMAMAFHELDLAGRVRLHVRIDERSAAFTALGLAKASRRPAAVLCTSRTPPANFPPALTHPPH